MCLSVCTCVRLFTFEVLFYRLFAPTFRSRQSKKNWDSESLGESCGKKWSQIGTFLLKNCLKSPRQKKLITDFFHLFTFEVPLKRLFAPLPKVRCPNFLEIGNPSGKVMESRWSQIWIFLLKRGLNLPRQKKFLNHFFFFICSLYLNVFLPQLPKVQCPNFLDFSNPWGKLMKRSGRRFEYFCS